MKQLYLHIKLAALSMLLFSACTQDEIMNQANVEKPITDGILSIGSVKVDDFIENTESRVINDSKTVTFEAGTNINDANGDELGILLIDESGKAYANVAFKYVNENGENKWLNKTNEYYSSKIKKAIAYFPYTEITEDLPSSIEELKQIFLSKDVSFEEKDLLVSETTEFHAASMDINFTHAFSMLTFSAEATTTTSNGSEITYPLQLSDVAFSIGDNLYTPELVNGKYVCLIDNETLAKDEFRYFYTANNTPYVKTVSNETPLTLEANKSYSFPCPINTGEGTAMAAGDFYCVSSDDVLVLPGSAAGIPEGWTCKGIVFHVMDSSDSGSGNEWSTFLTNNQLTEADLPGYNGKHGLVVSLTTGEPLGIKNENKADIESAYTTAGANANLYQSKDELCGYILSKALLNSNTLTNIFTALDNHKSENIANTTGWYCPSYQELENLMNELTIINQQMNIAQGEQITASPTLTYSDAGFWLIRPDLTNYNGDVTEAVRPICAF